MTAGTAFMFASALSAVFGIVYLPVLMRQPKAFVSPYAKADIRKRASAAIADGLLVATCVVLYSTQDSMLLIAIGAAYLLLRDALFIPGQSVGKFLFGLRVDQPGRWPTLRPLAFSSAKLHPARAGVERRGGRARDPCDSCAIRRGSGSAICSRTRKWWKA